MIYNNMQHTHPNGARGGKPARAGARPQNRKSGFGGARFKQNRDVERSGGAFRVTGPRPSFGRRIHVPGETVGQGSEQRTSSQTASSSRGAFRSTGGSFRGRSQGGSGGRSFGGGFRGRSQGGFRGGSKRGKNGGRGERIDHSRFIRKAELVEVKPYIAQHKFSDFPFDARLSKNVEKKGFEHPTPIQDQAIPLALAGRDIFGLANTGTGKTAAFLLPLIQKVLNSRKEQVLILAPTRELALQIEKEFVDFTYGTSLFSVSAVGGMPIFRQVTKIRRGVSFVIGTPGRVKDLIDRKVLNLATFKSIVLDEADRMLDMGFRDDMEFVMNKMADERHTLFFSATMSPDIKKLSEKFLKDPEFISVVVRETSKNIDQDVVRVISRDKKIDQLHDILIDEQDSKILIFSETKRDVDRLARELVSRGFRVGAIHGDKRNRERVRTLEDFKTGRVTILIATDVAARGLDIPDVTHVINYDVPQTYDTYVHRIGRTGRAGKTGKALTFVH
jgi:superfamily II DNA/RNA helicase